MPRTRGATVFGAGHCWAPAHFWLCLFEGQVCELCSGLLAKAPSCPCALIYPAPTRTHPEPPEGLPTSCPPACSTGRLHSMRSLQHEWPTGSRANFSPSKAKKLPQIREQ